MIVGVAVKFNNDVEIRLPRPKRHCHCFDLAKEKGIDPTQCIGSHGQGFYTDTGEYLTRKEAMAHVRSIGQKLYTMSGCGEINISENLFSEDVWED